MKKPFRKRRRNYKGPEHRKRYLRDWEERNREPRKAYKREWHDKNREARNRYRAAWARRQRRERRALLTPWKLTPTQMKYLRMLVDGYKQIEISRVVGVRRPTVTMTLWRAVDRMYCVTIEQAIRKLAEGGYFKDKP